MLHRGSAHIFFFYKQNRFFLKINIMRNFIYPTFLVLFCCMLHGASAQGQSDVCEVPNPASFADANQKLQENQDTILEYFRANPEQLENYKQLVLGDSLVAPHTKMTQTASQLFIEHKIKLDATKFCTDDKYQQENKELVPNEVWDQLEPMIKNWRHQRSKPGFMDQILGKIKSVWSEMKKSKKHHQKQKKPKTRSSPEQSRPAIHVQSQACRHKEGKKLLWALIRLPMWIGMFVSGFFTVYSAVFIYIGMYLLNLVGILLSNLPFIGRGLAFTGFLTNAARQLTTSLGLFGMHLFFLGSDPMMKTEAKEYLVDAGRVIRHQHVGKVDPFQGVLHPEYAWSARTQPDEYSDDEYYY